MNLLLYAKGSTRAGKRLESAIEALALELQPEIFTSDASLGSRLCRLPYYGNIAVLMAATQKELSELLNLKDRLKEIPIILILPDREARTVSMGHKLYPRFVSYADGDFMDVAAVLKKMVENMNSKYQWARKE